MIDKRNADNLIYQEMNEKDREFWFNFKRQKFLHNIDTFYYSVKFLNDFTSDSVDEKLIKMRMYFNQQKLNLDDYDGSGKPLYFPGCESNLNLINVGFAGFYNVCLRCPDFFDLFIAPVVPHGSDGGESLTCEWIVQIRSYMLWMYGSAGAFERSYAYIKAIAGYFGLTIAYVQENRVDYCWHSNYLKNPEKFFSIENFYRMRCDRFRSATFHTEKVGSDSYEVDYVACGKRSDKVFLRIYLKSKEVVEKGYKPWFFKVWLFNGLINRYDMYVYEECFRQRSWQYRYMARLKYYLEYGNDILHKHTIEQLLDNQITMSDDKLIEFANKLTPELNLIINVEFQTMRRQSKSFDLLPFKDNSLKAECRRIYDYLDNHRLIIDYLTHDVFRLVNPSGDQNKSRRDDVGFWKALRRTKLVDALKTPDEIKLTRLYNKRLNADVVKKRVLKSAVTYGLYVNGINDRMPINDMLDIICTLNDNDIQDMDRFKRKKTTQLNASELDGVVKNEPVEHYSVYNNITGEIYSYDYSNISEE